MFDEWAFQSWSLVLVGAALFAVLFGVLALLVEVHFAGMFRITHSVGAFMLAAFAGYVAVASYIRRSVSKRIS